MPHQQFAALRLRVESAYLPFITALDQAGRHPDPRRLEELRESTDVLMRALAGVMLAIAQTTSTH